MTYRDHISTDSLADHAEGLLGESESGQIEAHLAECDDCRSTALLLASIPEILAADEVGPMPAHFASRIDAALADLYAAEPVVFRPEPAAATPILTSPIGAVSTRGGPANNVVDLASRRKLALTGLRRVSTIAASMVLLIAGAALGIQTVGKDKTTAEQGAQEELTPQITALASPVRFITVPKNTKPGNRPNYRVDEKGWLYTPGKVFAPDGRVFLVDSRGNVKQELRPGAAPKTQPQPEAPAATTAPKATKQPVKPKKGGGDLATAKQPGQSKQQPGTGTRTQAPITPDQDPSAPGQSVEPAPTTSSEKAVQAQGADREAVPSDDPYVQESYQAYTEDTFAALVMDLVSAARRHTTNQNEFGASSTQSSPTATPSAASRYQLPTSLRIAFDKWNLPQDTQDTDRGPAAEKFQARVKRCAKQLGANAIAGDFGTWLDRPATIVVLQSEKADQVDGYVFYGNCSKDRPITAQSAQWQQRVNKPARDTAPEPTPVRRVGSVQQNATDAQSRYRGR